MNGLDQRGKTSVAASEVEEAIDAIRQPLEQRPFTFGPMRDPVGARQVFERVVGRCPEI